MVQTLAGGNINEDATNMLNADMQDNVQFANSMIPITGYSLRYYQSPCTGPNQS